LGKALNLSIIVPVLNEAERITALLEYLTLNIQSPSKCEIIIVDGGSTDGSQHKIKTFIDANPTLAISQLDSAKGRAVQMNIGANNTNSDLLYFLHADSFPPRHFDQLILSQTKLGNAAGCFRMRFDSNHWWLKTASWFTKFNWKACRGGDQSLFVTKDLFNTIGGFNEDFKICEDNEMISHLYKANQFVVISDTIITSARLYRKKGVWRLQYHFYVIYLKKRLGASPEALYSYYEKKITNAC